MVTYFAGFDPNFAITLRERPLVALLIMQVDVVALEGNLITDGKIKWIRSQVSKDKKKDKKNKENKKVKEELEALVLAKESAKAKIEEMDRLIRSLSNKITRLEVEAQTPACFPPLAPRNPNTFRRPFNPHILPRERRTKEQPLQPPIRWNLKNMMEEAYEEDPRNHQGEMHWLDDKSKEIHLTRDEYSKSVNSINYSKNRKINLAWLHSNIK